MKFKIKNPCKTMGKVIHIVSLFAILLIVSWFWFEIDELMITGIGLVFVQWFLILWLQYIPQDPKEEKNEN